MNDKMFNCTISFEVQSAELRTGERRDPVRSSSGSELQKYDPDFESGIYLVDRR